jgi:hypothetical protein
MSKKDLPEYVVPFGLIVIALVVDITLIATAGAADASWLGSYFHGSIVDWVGIFLFNVSILALSSGLMGYWSVFTSDAKSWGRLWLISLAVSIGLIYL